jgi:hypothetical protein
MVEARDSLNPERDRLCSSNKRRADRGNVGVATRRLEAQVATFRKRAETLFWRPSSMA